MDITGRKTRKALEAMETKFDELRRKNEVQALLIDDISTVQKADGIAYAGNEYRDYITTITEIASKYSGEAKWGVLQTGNIIDVRAAFIIGQGVAVLPTEKKHKDSEEIKFVKDFFAYNNLDREMAQEFAKEAEIEGCFLGQLIWNDSDKQPSIQFMSRVDKNYTVSHAVNDYSWYTRVAWKESGSTTEKVLEEPEFIYARFGGRIHQPNKPIPKVGKCLTQIEAMDKALRDWREINHLYSAPIPVIECANAADVQKMNEATATINWKLRKRIVIAGKVYYVSPSLQGSNEALEKEITTNAKMISGTTGCPVHFLGLPELMSNRATADNLMELVGASTRKERMIWEGAYKEIIEKAMALRNDKSALTKLDPSKIKVSIPYITEQAWQRIIDVWLPLYTANAVNLEMLLEQIPGIDTDVEFERVEKRKAEALEKFSKGAGDEEEEEDDDGE